MSDSGAAPTAHLHGASAEQITKASGSNLALAFIALPPHKRRDMSIFYGFCRVVDDIADEPGIDPAERRRALDLWSRAVESPVEGEPPLAAEVRGVIERYRLSPRLFREIILGCEMDLAEAVYETWEDLRLYCHRVASVVGLVSVEIFGYTDPAAKVYATELGLALQVTNIVRDVGQDYENGGRIYLPREDMARFGYSAADLAARRHNEAFLALMNFEAARARELYASAAAAKPAADRRTLVAADIMRRVYEKLLGKMEREGFRVFDGRCRLSRLQKLWCVIQGLLAR